MRYPPHLQRLIEILRRFPGVGSRSAERFAFNLLSWDLKHLLELAQALEEIPIKIKHCSECGCLQGEEACPFCVPARVETKLLCIVATARDALSIESTREFGGLYHVLGGLISPLESITPENWPLID